MFTLTLADQQQTARSLSYAKALAPQMFQRAGTQHLFHLISIEDSEGNVVGTYGREGWKDTEPEPPYDDRDDVFRIPKSHRLTRYEQLEGLADRGIDSWEEYRGEK